MKVEDSKRWCNQCGVEPPKGLIQTTITLEVILSAKTTQGSSFTLCDFCLIELYVKIGKRINAALIKSTNELVEDPLD